jgi:hypothetical protein
MAFNSTAVCKFGDPSRWPEDTSSQFMIINVVSKYPFFVALTDDKKYGTKDIQLNFGQVAIGKKVTKSLTLKNVSGVNVS